uniref:DNA-directed RNA polymerase subunit alpha n=1 Tax=Nitella hyalina TaxID=181804 RepID=A0A2H4G553_NITHY|nr:RNA polymerase alpha subunit [Nitella hyalina]APP89432.1 RNA polymerase alpha subunit [Nitella hyalina]WKT08439.1 RNA polymerase alpha subunit [Nitella hyalina]
MIQYITENCDQIIQWKCLESKIESQRIHYGRFAIAPLNRGQANTLGVTLRRTLLADLEGISITSVKFENIKHEYSTLIGIRESVQDILLNLKEIVFQGIPKKTQKGFIFVKGPKKITTADIRTDPCIQVIDSNQIIAHLTESIDFRIELTIEKSCGYRLQDERELPQGVFSVDAVFMPVRNVNYSIHPIEQRGDLKKELLVLEIWTNGSITPKEALYQTSQKLLNIFLSLAKFSESKLEVKDKVNFFARKKEEIFLTQSYKSKISLKHEIPNDLPYKDILINKLELSARAYNCLKSAQVNTLFDLLNFSQEDLLKIKNFGKRSAQQVIDALEKYLNIKFSKKTSEKFWLQLKK